MIYVNSRPLNARPAPKTTNRRYEWRDFSDDSQGSEALIRERFEFDRDETRVDKYFLLPGRAGQITKMNDNEVFEIKTLIEEDGPLELWETTVKSTVPMRRTLARSIAAKIPKFSGPVIGSMSADELSDSLERKTRFFKVKTKRETFKRGDVTAKISRARVGDTHTLSIAFECDTAEPLLEELKALGLRRRENTNYATFLMNNA